MSQEQHSATQSPLGAVMAIGGGIVAQAAPNTGVGAAGLIASIAGLLMAGFQYYKTWMDSKNYVSQIQGLKDDLKAARDGRHADANRFNGLILDLQGRVREADLAMARLEGKLGLTDRTHATAINNNSDNIANLANGTGIRPLSHQPHLEATGPEAEPQAPPE